MSEGVEVGMGWTKGKKVKKGSQLGMGWGLKE